MTTTISNSITNKDDASLMAVKTKKKIASMQSKIEELQAQLQIDGEDINKEPLTSDTYISVMSLIPYTLNLTIKSDSDSGVKVFKRFGETKTIVYHELHDIIELHRNFVEAGYFYILDARVIEAEGLREVYKSILTKKMLDELLSENSTSSNETRIELFNSANPDQQEIIIQSLIESYTKDSESLDLNYIDKISKISKRNIVEEAENLTRIRQEYAKKVEEIN